MSSCSSRMKIRNKEVQGKKAKTDNKGYMWQC